MARLANRAQLTGGHIIHPQHSFRPSRPLCPTQLLPGLSLLHCQSAGKKCRMTTEPQNTCLLLKSTWHVPKMTADCVDNDRGHPEPDPVPVSH